MVYFDFYLMHAQDHENYKKFQRCKAYETAYSFKEAGLIKHFGLSFHDTPEVLTQILTDHPEVEFVQIQFNYADYESDDVQSRRVYEVCEKFGKPVIVMEPVKGGNLVNLPSQADQVLRELGGGTNASYAIRFAASFPQMMMVLSGMSNMEQMNDNLSFMKDFKPLDETERAAVKKVCEILDGIERIPCTGCRYCIEENTCPMSIRIPDMFNTLNSVTVFGDPNAKGYYQNVLTSNGNGKASDCLKCGMCEEVCPQHLDIRDLLDKVSEAFD